jgi:acyl carrier protein
MADVPSARRRRIVQDRVASAAARALGIAADRQLDEHRPFHELGLDSLMAVELRNVLAREVGEPLPATLLFDYPTLATLVDFLCTRVCPADPPVSHVSCSGREEDAGDHRDVLDQIEELSDEDVERLLAARSDLNR